MRAPALLAALVVSTPAAAQLLADQGPPQHRLVHKNTFALRYNPLGLLYSGSFTYRYRLYQTPSVALRDNFVGGGLNLIASPAFVRVGPMIEVNPLTVFGLFAAVQFVQYFGTFNLYQGFPSANSNFSDTALKQTAGTTANGWEVTFGANLQLKVGPMVIRSQARLLRPDMGTGDRIYYDQFYDLGVPNRGWFFTNDLDVLWQGLSNKLFAGLRYTASAPFYDPNKHVAPGESVPDNSTHRVGPFLGYTFKSEDGAKFNNPTVFLLIQWFLKHPYRTGVDVSRALPLLGVGFQFTGDFLPVK
ncbi:MAG: hypothetical protein AMXMBFR34_18190 [Myxococcaceae bacterium]